VSGYEQGVSYHSALPSQIVFGIGADMAVEFRLPELSDQTNEGVVVAWFKKEGTSITKGERLLEVQMEKVRFEIVAPFTGTIHRILAPRDKMVKNGDLLAVLVEAGEDVKAGRIREVSNIEEFLEGLEDD